MKVLTFMDWYLPGFKAGGPVRTIANMVTRLAGEVEFWIATRDRDPHDTCPYAGVQPDAWNEVAGARVWYFSPSEGIRAIVGLCRTTAHDAVYLNSFFSRLTIAYLIARVARATPRVPVILAPRGEFARPALRIRGTRKRLYLALAGRLGLLRGILWQASTEHERSDIEAALRAVGGRGIARGILVAPDLVGSAPRMASERPPKEPGRARFLFLSRIARMKNLHSAIRLLAGLRGEVSLDVYGPIDDAAYWAESQREARALPPNVVMRAHGPVRAEEVQGVMCRHDFLLLPTLGENFGHVIAEALTAGTPVVLSDRTSWSLVATRNAGWCIPLEDEIRWREVLQSCVDLGDNAHADMRAAAALIGGEVATSTEALAMNRSLFRTVRSSVA